jgi:hypothetical protein
LIQVKMKFWICILALLLSVQSARSQSLTIDSAEVDVVRDQLLLFGDFGSETGRVFIDSVELPIVRWMPNWIRADLPRSGRGSAGDVVVRKNGFSGSAIRITAFDVTTGYHYIVSESRNNWSVYGEGGAHYFGSFRAALNQQVTRDVVPARDASGSRGGTFTDNTSFGQGEFRRSSQSCYGVYTWSDSSGQSGVKLRMAIYSNGTGRLSVEPRGAFKSETFTSEMRNGNYTSTYDTSTCGAPSFSYSFSIDSNWNLELKDVINDPCPSFSNYRSTCWNDLTVSTRFAPRPVNTLHVSQGSDPMPPSLLPTFTVVDLLGKLVKSGVSAEEIDYGLTRGVYLAFPNSGNMLLKRRILVR